MSENCLTWDRLWLIVRPQFRYFFLLYKTFNTPSFTIVLSFPYAVIAHKQAIGHARDRTDLA